MKNIILFLVLLFLSACYNGSVEFNVSSIEDSINYFKSFERYKNLETTESNDSVSNSRIGVFSEDGESCGGLPCSIIGDEFDRVSSMFLKVNDFDEAKKVIKDVGFPLTEEIKYVGNHTENLYYENSRVFQFYEGIGLRIRRLKDDSFILYFGFNKESIDFIEDYIY